MALASIELVGDVLVPMAFGAMGGFLVGLLLRRLRV